MQIEYEAKFLDINPKAFHEKLKNLGAKLIYPERLMRRRNFDYSDRRLEKKGGWIRVRDEGNMITLAYKELLDRTLDGTKEVSFSVSDFDKTCDFLLSIGLSDKSYHETKREKWEFNDAEVTIDTWPWIPTFVEIEANDEKGVWNASQELGFDWKNALHGSVETAYQKYFNVTEEEVYLCKSITFVQIPDWLERKRKIC